MCTGPNSLFAFELYFCCVVALRGRRIVQDHARQSQRNSTYLKFSARACLYSYNFTEITEYTYLVEFKKKNQIPPLPGLFSSVRPKFLERDAFFRNWTNWKIVHAFSQITAPPEGMVVVLDVFVQGGGLLGESWWLKKWGAIRGKNCRKFEK